jgi:BirA family biotin operon repressor/biotin-[acetyl-CoA-carboxylase] ligase
MAALSRAALFALVSCATARSYRVALRMAASSAAAGGTARPRLDRVALASRLRTAATGQQLEYHEETDSTMFRAAAVLAERGGRAAHGTLILADWQTGGIGRRGRSWDSDRAQNLLFSIVWSPPALERAPPAQVLAHMMQLNLAVSVAVVRACEEAGASGARVKWPNDVWARERKLAGSLVNFDGERAAVIGIGLNVNERCATSEEGAGEAAAGGPGGHGYADAAWRSVQRISVRELLSSEEPVAREPLLAGVCNALEGLMELPPDAFVRAYREADMLIGRSIRVHHVSREVDDPRDYEGEVLGITAEGFLRVRRADGEVALSGEEVSITPRRAALGGGGGYEY